ncbi:MAG: GNAT family N-acetyltransferase [Anaerolineaceae bacterium]
MIVYTDSLEGITDKNLMGGFFAGWPNPPAPEVHFRILSQSYARILARTEDGTVVGFITAISDGVSCAYIPFLEVLPAYQHHGIGTELIRRMLKKLDFLYMVDLTCDPELQPFYEQSHMYKAVGMMVRNFKRQSCNNT